MPRFEPFVRGDATPEYAEVGCRPRPSRRTEPCATPSVTRLRSCGSAWPDNTMHQNSPKPRLTFFQYRYSASLPRFVLLHTQEHVKCLSESFDVTVINEDCDYSEVCEKHRPDLTLFEGSYTVPFSECRRPAIANARANPNIPRVGFLHSDAFSQGR